MKSPQEWREDFQARYGRGVGNLNISGVSFDMNRLIEELAEDIQNDALGLPSKERVFGIVTRAEAEAKAARQGHGQ
jgi:hypothetical protein